MEFIKAKVMKNWELYKNYPEINKYFGEYTSCIKCAYNTTASFSKTEITDRTVESNRSETRNDSNERVAEKTKKKSDIQEDQADGISISERIVLTRLGFCNFYKLPQVDLIMMPKEREKLKVELYLDFLNCIDLSSSKTSIRKFNLQVFHDVLLSAVIDKTIELFVEKVLKDPIEYPNKEKSDFVIILIYIYIYRKKRCLEIKRCKNMIDKVSHMFKSRADCDICFQDDPFIDRFVVEMRLNSADVDGAIFLNRMYLSTSNHKNMFEVFHQRLIESLALVQENQIFSFIKYVFTYSTVLFVCITETCLYKLVLSYYKNKAKMEQIATLLGVLIEKVDDVDQNKYFTDIFNSLELKTLKCKKLSLVVEIRAFSFVNEYKDYFWRNGDSFNGISIGLEEISRLYSRIKGKGKEVEILDALLSMVDSIKLEFFKQIIKTYNLLLIDMIGNIQKFDDSFVQFNKDCWLIISKVILLTQRHGIQFADENNKKKKICKKNIKIPEILQLSIRLVNIVTDVENKAISSGLNGIVVIQKRGFRIE